MRVRILPPPPTYPFRRVKGNGRPRKLKPSGLSVRVRPRRPKFESCWRNGRRAELKPRRPKGHEGSIPSQLTFGSWWNGRRAGLRCQWPKGREGSSPFEPTNFLRRRGRAAIAARCKRVDFGLRRFESSRFHQIGGWSNLAKAPRSDRGDFAGSSPAPPTITIP